MSKYTETGISVFKYLLAVFMMTSGVITAFSPLTPMSGSLGYLYSTRPSLVLFGIIFFCCGFVLLYGKMRRSRKWTGIGLFSITMCFIFATILQGIAYSWIPGYWVNNAIFAIVVGSLWLRWKFKTKYIDPKHFIDDMHKLK